MLGANLRRLAAQFLEWQRHAGGIVITPDLAALLGHRMTACAMLAEVMERETPAPAVPPPVPELDSGSNVVRVDFARASIARDQRRRPQWPEGGAA